MPLFVPSSPRSPPPIEGAPNHGPVHPTGSQVLFAASTIHVAHLAEVLASITAVDRHALMILSQSGITFYAEYNHIVNCHVTLDEALFSAFRYQNSADGDSGVQTSAHHASPVIQRTEIGIDAQLMSDAFGAAASAVPMRGKATTLGDLVVCYLRYEGEGTPLVVEFEDRLMNEMIEFATFYLQLEYPFGAESGDEDQGLVLDHSSLHFEVILQSDILVNLLQDLQSLDTQDLYLLISNCCESGGEDGACAVDFVSKGAIGYLKLEYPRSRTMLQKLEVYQDAEGDRVSVKETVLCVLAFSPFMRIFRAVKLLSKCKIMEDFGGVLSIQLLCKTLLSANYPGTMITFNMLEITNLGDGAIPTTAHLSDLFHESAYKNSKEYLDTKAKAASAPPSAPLSYRSFQRGSELASASPPNTVELPFFL